MKAEYDVIVIGSGIAGSLVAWKLARQGVSVLILEAGDYGPGKDDDGELANRLAKVKQWSTATPKLPSSPYVNKRSNEKAPIPIVTSIKDGYFDQSETTDTYKSNYERLVGGSTWHWLGNVPRLLPNDFKMKTRFGVSVDWPISYADLEPYYVEAEHAIGVAGDHDLWDGVHGAFRSRDFPMQKVWECYGDSVIKRRIEGKAIRDVPLEILPTPQARNSEPFDNRPPCAGNSICVPICPIHAKYDATIHVRKATETQKDDPKTKKNAVLQPRCVVTRLETSTENRVAKVHYLEWNKNEVQPDEEKFATARIVVVAAHAIESAKLLLHSRLANSSDQLGRNLMDHLQGYGGAIMPEPMYPFRGPPTTSGIDAFRDGLFRSREGAFRMSMGNDGWGRQETPYETVGKLVREDRIFGTQLKERIADRITRMFRVSYSTEQLPESDNRVQLSDKQDAIGLPRPKITYRVGDYNRRARATGRETVQKLFEFLDAEETRIRYPQDIRYSGAGHIMGTCRMGSDPDSSVVDAECRTHDHRNLFVVSSAVFFDRWNRQSDAYGCRPRHAGSRHNPGTA